MFSITRIVPSAIFAIPCIAQYEQETILYGSLVTLSITHHYHHSYTHNQEKQTTFDLLSMDSRRR